jgi:hypothetical protein
VDVDPEVDDEAVAVTGVGKGKNRSAAYEVILLLVVVVVVRRSSRLRIVDLGIMFAWGFVVLSLRLLKYSPTVSDRFRVRLD